MPNNTVVWTVTLNLVIPNIDRHGVPVNTVADVCDYVSESLRDEAFIDWDWVQGPVAVEVCDPYTEGAAFTKEPATPTHLCSRCGSSEVFRDAWVGVNDPSDVRTFDATFCMDCDGMTSLTQVNS